MTILMSGGELKTWPDPKADFSGYKTYSWLAPRIFTKAGIVEDDPEFTPMVKKAVNKQLAAKGMTEVETGGDLQVISAGVSSGTQQLEAYLVTWGFDAYWGYSYGMVSPVQRYNKEGTLVVGLVDTKTKKGVWVGMATESLGKQSMVEGAVNHAAERMFKKYPPKKK
jgi:hypothetical protein